ncbi:IS3 family transposase [Spiroplasma endosymbiont of Atherix ibis]|uniref:IS3 family transposase n=1 Tax=Spiroplasma endosymbiont of Atherix ibis TaxID=3066291 RepID=UPI0030CE4E82
MSKEEKINFIKSRDYKTTIKELLELLNLKKSYWDKYKNHCFIDKKNKFDYIKYDILKVFNDNRKQFGYRQVSKEISHKYSTYIIRKVMRENKIIARFAKNQLKKANKRKLQNSNVEYPDLVQRKYSAVKEKYKILYTDITYLIWKGKKAYKSTIIDGFTKEVISSDISYKMSAKFVIATLKRAINVIKKIKDPSGIIIHSDHGVQYTSKTWKTVCDSNNLIISMGAKKTCADNIVIESYHSLLKKWTIHNNKYESLEHYITDVIEWDKWYNSKKSQNSFLNIEWKNKDVFYGTITI